MNKLNIQIFENDECYTKKEDANNLANYLIDHNIIYRNAKIWLPFGDNEHTNIYLALFEHGFQNLITTEGDFYELADKIEYDIIISNPPFAKRTRLFTKLMELNKPFILLQPDMFFKNTSCVKILTDNCDNFGMLMPQKRIGFIMNGVEMKSTTAFYSFWLCYKTQIKNWKKLI